MNTQTPCQEWLTKLALKHEDFSTPEWDAFSRHLKECPACSARRTEYGVVIAELSNLPSLIPQDVPNSSCLLSSLYDDIQAEELSYSLSIRTDHETQRESTTYREPSHRFTDYSTEQSYEETYYRETAEAEKSNRNGLLAYSGFICLLFIFLIGSMGFFVMTQTLLTPPHALMAATPSVNTVITVNNVSLDATNFVGIYYANITTQNYYQAYSMLDSRLQKHVTYLAFIRDPNYTLYANWDLQSADFEVIDSVVLLRDSDSWMTDVSVQVGSPMVSISDRSNTLPVQYKWSFQVIKDDNHLAINSVRLSNVSPVSQSHVPQKRYVDTIRPHYGMIWKKGRGGTIVPPLLHNKQGLVS